MSTDQAGTATPDYAHRVVPEINGLDYLDGDRPVSDLPGRLARYRAARAYGFYMGVRDGLYDAADGIVRYLYEFELASVWWQLDAATEEDGYDSAAYRDVKRLAPEIAADIVTVTAEAIGPNIVAILEHYGIDPASIRPYNTTKEGGA